MGIGFKAGGRKKGTPNKEKRTGTKAHRAVIAMSEAMSVTKSPTSAGPLDASHGVETENFGILPLDVLLIAMRRSWNLAQRKSAAADEADTRVVEIEAEADKLEASPQRDALSARAAEARKYATMLRLEAGTHLSLATGLAKDACPYQHARLQAVDAHVKQSIVVVRATF